MCDGQCRVTAGGGRWAMGGWQWAVAIGGWRWAVGGERRAVGGGGNDKSRFFSYWLVEDQDKAFSRLFFICRRRFFLNTTLEFSSFRSLGSSLNNLLPT